MRAWVKNDHLGYEIIYVYKVVVKKYRPYVLIRLARSKMLVLEVKGQDTQQNKTKREFLAEWVKAVNTHGGFDLVSQVGLDVGRQIVPPHRSQRGVAVEHRYNTGATLPRR